MEGDISTIYLPPPGESSWLESLEDTFALSAIHLISSKHHSIVSGVELRFTLERSHTSGSSLQLGLTFLLGLVEVGWTGEVALGVVDCW